MKNIISSRNPILWIGSIVILYFIIGRLSLLFVVKPENIAVIWPLSGVFLSALLLTQKNLRHWLAIALFITDFVIEMLAGSSVAISLTYSFALTFDAVFSTWLLLRFVDSKLTFDKTKHVVLFLLLSVLLSNAVSSLIMAFSSFYFTHQFNFASVKVWFISDGVGNLLVTPFIMSWFFNKKKAFTNFKINKGIEGASLFIVTLILTYAIFKKVSIDDHIFLYLICIAFPLFIWSALRFGIRGLTSMSLVFSIVVLYFVINQQDFSEKNPQLKVLIEVQLFIVIMTIPSLFLAAVVSERKQVNQALLETELKYQELYENAPDMFVSVDPETALILRCNETLIKNTGYSRNEIVGMPIFDIYHPDCMEKVKIAFQEFVAKGEVNNAELQLKRKNGSKIDVILNVISVRDSSGKILYSNSSWRDITDLKKTQSFLLDSEKKYHSFFDNSLDAIMLTSLDGSIQAVNQAACKMFGLTEEEICTLGRNGLIDLNDERLPELLITRKEKGFAFGELNMLRKDGSVFPVEISSAIFKDYEGNERTSMIIRDISERKNTETALQKSELHYRMLFEHMLEAMAYHKIIYKKGKAVDYIYLEVNDAFTKHTGLKDVVGKRVSEIVPGIQESNPQLLERFGRVALTGKTEQYETFIASSKTWFDTTLYSIETDVVISIFSNITERKLAEEEIKNLNNELEQKVIERTKELETKYDELDKLNKVFVGRELRMIELKNRISELERRLSDKMNNQG